MPDAVQAPYPDYRLEQYMQTITIAPPKRSWFSLLSWAIVLAVLVVS